jgi:hypothetical protein
MNGRLLVCWLLIVYFTLCSGLGLPNINDRRANKRNQGVKTRRGRNYVPGQSHPSNQKRDPTANIKKPGMIAHDLSQTDKQQRAEEGRRGVHNVANDHSGNTQNKRNYHARSREETGKQTGQRVRNTDLPAYIKRFSETKRAYIHNKKYADAYDLKNKKPMVWFHIQKAAGSWVCQRANEHEMLTYPSINCNMKAEGDDASSLGKEVYTLDCEERAEIFQNLNATWTHIERDWRDIDLRCPQFLYGTMLREPSNLMTSNLHFRNIKVGGVKAVVDYIHGRGGMNLDWVSRLIIPRSRRYPVGPALNFRLFDNVMVRLLNGLEGWHTPAGQVSQQQFEHAKQVLDTMDVVMILEHLDRDLIQLKKRWWAGGPEGVENPKEVGKETDNRANTTKKPKQDSLRTLLSPSYYQELMEINKHDVALYKYALQLAFKLSAGAGAATGVADAEDK